ncbi:Uncharacterized protein APZ42_013161 [Daphnia magna]|uniref:Uncharacterized protein n=1 Tax=Daphnia magna TaxID=35525 RepID=A0A162R1R4_9CRUS|nr:Uncharacterized protein APZ42_013161 [Daphnia magna]
MLSVKRWEMSRAAGVKEEHLSVHSLAAKLATSSANDSQAAKTLMRPLTAASRSSVFEAARQ